MFKLTDLAAEDFESIYEYTLLNFGIEQADFYTEELETVLNLLSKSPKIGRDVSNLVSNVRRHDHASHAIFYKERASDILIIRIVNQNMDIVRQINR